MNAPDIRHALAPDLALLVPPSFAVRTATQGLSAIEAGTGIVLSVLLKSSTIGTPDDERLLESTLALLQKKHVGAERIGVPASITTSGCRGRCALLRATTRTNAPIHIVVTTLIAADPVTASLQRNLIVVLEVPTPAFGQRPAFYQRFALERLRIGAAATAPIAPQAPERSASENPADPEAPAARVEPLAAPPSAPTITPGSAAAPHPRPVAKITEPAEDELLASAALGQRTLTISIVLTFVARAIGNVPDVPIFLAYAVSAAVLIYAIGGVLKICSGFRYSLNHKLVLMFCSSIPLIGIVCWVWLSIRTTRRLRAAGFEVGLFGVRS